MLKEVLIYGKEGCPYCERAKMLTAKIQEKHPEVKLKYVDFVKENLTKEEVSKLVNAPEIIQTVPQIKLFWEDKEEYIGGFDKYYSYITQNTSLLK